MLSAAAMVRDLRISFAEMTQAVLRHGKTVFDVNVDNLSPDNPGRLWPEPLLSVEMFSHCGGFRIILYLIGCSTWSIIIFTPSICLADGSHEISSFVFSENSFRNRTPSVFFFFFFVLFCFVFCFFFFLMLLFFFFLFFFVFFLFLFFFFCFVFFFFQRK